MHCKLFSSISDFSVHQMLWYLPVINTCLLTLPNVPSVAKNQVWLEPLEKKFQHIHTHTHFYMVHTEGKTGISTEAEHDYQLTLAECGRKKYQVLYKVILGILLGFLTNYKRTRMNYCENIKSLGVTDTRRVHNHSHCFPRTCIVHS